MEPDIPVIDWQFLRKADGSLALVPRSYAEAIKLLRFLNDFRIRRELLGVVIARSPNG